MPTGIEWTDETWNPATGCSMVSPGCHHCYAARMARRLDGQGVGYDGTTDPLGRTASVMSGAYWSGQVNWLPERLEQPLRWRKPRRVFVCSMADLFHEELSFERIAAVFGVMAATPRHTYQVLTKRASRMVAFFDWLERQEEPADLIVQRAAWEEGARLPLHPIKETLRSYPWPLLNVWLGVSIEDQRRLEERLHHLMETPAAVRFLSCEPLLGELDFEDGPLSEERAAAIGWPCLGSTMGTWSNLELGVIHWVIAGGESGIGARPLHPAWVRKLRDDTTAAGVAFFFKQWGTWAPYISSLHSLSHRREVLEAEVHGEDSDAVMVCVGKKRAGRRLDGRTWDETPTTEDSDGKT